MQDLLGLLGGLLMRLIGLLGSSYCGSTMLGCIFGGLPGVEYIGESHWIIDGPNKCRCWMQDVPPAECHLNAALMGLRLDQVNWWERLSDVLGASVLVSGDKHPKHFDRFGLPDVAVTIRRDVRGWCVSYCHLKKMKREDRDLVLAEVNPTEEELTEAAELYRSTYQHIDSWRAERCIPGIGVDLDQFLELPEVELYQICSALGLPFDADALHFEAKIHHHIGGNAQVGMRKITGHRPRYHEERRRLRGGFPKPDTAWQQVLTEQQATMVQEIAWS